MFQDTMVNLKWTDVQKSVDQNALVLLPLGVIEEHGPQLCLGTDIYTAHIQCLFIKQKLEEKGFNVVIAPPFYWGICQATGSFIGSFRIRKETAKALLLDIMTSLAGFGFKQVFGVNAHGDIEQQVVILEAFKEASETLNIQTVFAFPQGVMHHYGLNGSEPYICPVRPQTIQVSTARAWDVHGGDIETATIHHFYPELVDTEKAKSLPPLALGDDQIMTWIFGGHTQELSPDGYVGSPADFEGVDVMKNVGDYAERISEAILTHIGNK
jgi:creatinine amidohydrolase